MSLKTIFKIDGASQFRTRIAAQLDRTLYGNDRRVTECHPFCSKVVLFSFMIQFPALVKRDTCSERQINPVYFGV